MCVVIVSIVLYLIFLFTASSFFGFKEEYKRCHNKLFRQNGFGRPSEWKLSRQKNHDIFNVFKWLTILAILSTFILSNGSAFPLICMGIASVIILPLGIMYGKYRCKDSVKKQCEKFEIPYTQIWTECNLLKKSSGNSWRFCFLLNIFWLVNFEIHFLLYLLNWIKI